MHAVINNYRYLRLFIGDKVMQNSKKKVFSVLIPDGESWLAYSVQSCLAQVPGIELNVLSNNVWDPMRFSRYTRQFLSYSQKGNDDEAKLTAIYDAVKKTQADIVLPVDTETIRLLSLHSASLKTMTALAPVPEVEAIDIAANKWLLAEWLQKHQIACPITLLYQAGPDFEQALNALVFPVLLKPTQQIGDEIGVGGRGIHVFDNPSALLEFCKKNTTIEYVVQPFIKGYDMGCNVLCRAGKIDAYTIQKGFMAGRERFQPAAGIDFIDNADVYALISQLVAKMNWTGVANFDLRYDEQEQQVKVLEINPRFWGSLLGSFCAGVNYPYLSCLAGLGMDIPQTDIKPLRYVNGEAATAMLYQRFIKHKRQGEYFDNSALDFMIQDPVPKLVASCFKGYAKVMSRF
ncbi:putative Carbamoylphosphate synthase large subunit [Crenothrix polyspora]|uniref:Putative Carbamoylphosphate synthase large subunit n=1 Tax=Crenothrix polyspora TaxID=360316 RepID=A0A1R4GZV9_9GAMM|nr:ATP-grasp domain-containing protein [Crenothrix polyspora]SJM89511.1 putative Carbamoylphosphate synthase large subunit [Crenothrix polyspora]